LAGLGLRHAIQARRHCKGSKAEQASSAKG
jgi:hypothetical protein